jgi:hypothetical protein
LKKLPIGMSTAYPPIGVDDASEFPHHCNILLHLDNRCPSWPVAANLLDGRNGEALYGDAGHLREIADLENPAQSSLFKHAGV